jgi:hypothetical protein
MSAKLEIKIKTPPNKGASSQPSKPNKKANTQSGEQKSQCIACRADKKRCTRITAKDSELCYWHVDHLKYGIYSETVKPAAKKTGKKGDKKATTGDASAAIIITGPVNPDGQQPDPPKPKTRGRKRKQAIDPRFNDPAYITMWPEICDGTCVMVDRNDNVYTYGTDPVTFLGVKLLTGKIDKTASPRAGF